MVEMVKTLLNGEYEIILPKHRADRVEWHQPEGWEKKRLSHMKSTTKPGDIVYYVGAEEGDMCALLAQWGAGLILFEPNPLVWPNIKAIWEANKLPDLTYFFVGFASNKVDIKPDYFVNGGYNMGWPNCAYGDVIGNHGFKELAYESDVISQTKIDNVLSADPYRHYGIDMISLDVEGSEFEVLRGAEETLKKYHPRIYLSLHPEFMFNMFNEYSMDLRRWIMNLGYKETLLDYQHEAHFYYEQG